MSEREIQAELTDLHAVTLAELPTVGGVAAGLKRVLEHLDKSGTSLSGFNGAGGTVAVQLE